MDEKKIPAIPMSVAPLKESHEDEKRCPDSDRNRFVGGELIEVVSGEVLDSVAGVFVWDGDDVRVDNCKPVQEDVPGEHEEKGQNIISRVDICSAEVLGYEKDSCGRCDVDGASANAVEQKSSDLYSTEPADARAQFVGVTDEGDQDGFCDGNFKLVREDEGHVSVEHKEEGQNIPFAHCKVIRSKTDASVASVRASPIRGHNTVVTVIAVTAVLASNLPTADALVVHPPPHIDVPRVTHDLSRVLSQMDRPPVTPDLSCVRSHVDLPRVTTDASCVLMKVLPVLPILVNSNQKENSKHQINPDEDLGIKVADRTNENNLGAPKDHEDSEFQTILDCANLGGRCLELGTGLLPGEKLNIEDWPTQLYLLVKDTRRITRRFQPKVKYFYFVLFLAIATSPPHLCQDATCNTGEWMAQLAERLEHTVDFAIHFLSLHTSVDIVDRRDLVQRLCTYTCLQLTDFLETYNKYPKHKKMLLNLIGQYIAFASGYHYPEIWVVQFFLLLIETKKFIVYLEEDDDHDDSER